jgi:hypothetical protein
MDNVEREALGRVLLRLRAVEDALGHLSFPPGGPTVKGIFAAGYVNPDRAGTCMVDAGDCRIATSSETVSLLDLRGVLGWANETINGWIAGGAITNPGPYTGPGPHV